MMKSLFLITWAAIAAMSFGFEQQTRRGKSLVANSFDAYDEVELRVLSSGKGSKSSNGKGSNSSKSSKPPKGSKSLSSKSPKSGKGSKSLSSKMPKSGKGKGSKSFSSKSPKSGKSCKSSKSQSKGSKGSKGSLRGSDCDEINPYPCTTPEEKEATIRKIAVDISEDIAEGTPQDFALTWLLSDPGTDACKIDEVTERYALATLYFATGGASWGGEIGREGWLSEFPVCEAWVGIICKNNRVKKIVLHDNNLNGVLPNEVTSIKTLAWIDLFENFLTGSLPAKLGKLPLTFLGVDNNNFSGNPFTDSFLKLADTLTILRASNNTFAGSVPDSISNFSLLTELWIGNNNFDGSIPKSITKLKNLKSLIMKDNKFSGNIPANIEKLSGLHVLLLDGNSLTGEIPEGMSKLVELESLTLNDNELVGPIPTGFENFKNLKNLRLFGNKLNGPIPVLTQMTMLVELFLNNNTLTGPLPDFSNNNNMTRVDLSFNRLTGEVDKSIFELEELMFLYLDHNRLSGEIPQNFGNNEILVDLYLHENNFSGSIPGVVEGSATLRNISELLLQRNNFVGQVPPSLCKLRADINTETDPDEFQFKRFRTDCKPNDDGIIQNFCPEGCCDKCFIGKELQP